ncbi:MAG: sel1 repeat family protein [Bacteroidales bacterium]|nr:sel1 repeat family protein [Bacteroidales bacterium]
MKTTDMKEQKTKDEELLEKGWYLHIGHKYDCAARCYQEAAELGNTEALYFLALLYYEGKGVKKDLAEAAKCFKTVAEKGGKYSKEAQLRLERLADIDSGKGIGIIGVDMDYSIACGCGFGPGDVDEYRIMWKKAEQGDLEAQKYVASAIHIYMDCEDNPETDGETMMRYLRNLAQLGDASAQEKLAYTLINHTSNGVGIGDLDYEEALEWFRKAAQGGDSFAQWKLADFLYEGSFFGSSHSCLKQDKEEAFLWQMHYLETGEYVCLDDLGSIGYPYTVGDGKRWTTKEVFRLCKKYAQQGDVFAQRNLGSFYYDGECVKRNRATGIKWITKAAEQGDENAQFFLAGLYYEGEGVQQDYEEAFKWYMASAKQGRVKAQYLVGECYSNGIGVMQNEQEAVKWYRKSARHTDRDPWRMMPKDAWFACKKMGELYHEGKVVKQNDKIAAQWYEKAGRILMTLPATGMELCDIADNYFYGDGIRQNPEAAIQWYKRASRMGSHYAKTQLAEMYEEGTIVKQDYKEALKWYKKAAENGDVEALYKIGVYYLEGKGVKQNEKKAVACFMEAAIYGSKDAEKRLAKT